MFAIAGTTLPDASVFNSVEGAEDTYRFVVEAVTAVNAVVEAYGNCDAATVEDEKKTPCVSIEVVVAAVEVPNELSEPNGNAKKLPAVR
jgi:hypothetical protein